MADAEDDYSMFDPPSPCDKLLAHDRCRYCGCRRISVDDSAGCRGSRVCDGCGAVQDTVVFDELIGMPPMGVRPSNYRRVHHFHERVSQLLCRESQVPAASMLLICERLLEGKERVILSKDVVRQVLRHLKMQIYIEKWLSIISFCSSTTPPIPGPSVLQRLDYMFSELQSVWELCRPPGRANFLNYNFVFGVLFTRLGFPEMVAFFPQIKSRAKLRVLNECYRDMCAHLDWSEPTELPSVAPYSVCVSSPQTQLSRLRQLLASQEKAEPKTAYSRKEGRLLDQLARTARRSQQRAQSKRTELQVPSIGKVGRHWRMRRALRSQ